MSARFLFALAATAVSTAPASAQDSTGVADPTAFDDGGAYTSTDGEALYDTLCAGCHMPDGEGASGAGDYPALAGNPNLEFAVYPISIIINGQAAMPALGHLLSDEQVLEIVTYIQTHLGNDYAPDGDVQMVADTRPVEPQEDLAEHEIADPEPDREEAAEGSGGNEANSPDEMDAAVDDSGPADDPDALTEDNSD